jgi:ribosomal protein RSM22 (predicted rRNA methylase)
MTVLPPDIRAALQRLAEGQSRSALAGYISEQISEYRGTSLPRTVAASAKDALGYALTRMPATYAAVGHALEALASASPEFAPRTMTDAGCGPGTAALAAAQEFPELTEITLIDRNKPLLDMAENLLTATQNDRRHQRRLQDITQADAIVPADLVVASYCLVEMPQELALATALSLWQAAGQALVLVEPGTPLGFQRLAAVRTALLSKGAHPAAPCTHANTCPMATGGTEQQATNWCRTFVRVQRSRDHMMLKGGSLPYEDEPIAYLALTREPPTARLPYRIVGRKAETKIAMTLPVCSEQGLETLVVASRDKARFKRFRKFDWGDAVG